MVSRKGQAANPTSGPRREEKLMKMKAVVMTGANRPWEVQEVPVPKAEPGLVLVKVHASGMCYTDVWATQGAGGDIYP